MSGNFISELLQSITDRGRELLAKARREDDISPLGLVRLAGDLLTRRGEATGVALAEDVLARYAQLNIEGRRDFLLQLAHEFGPDRTALERAIDTYRKDTSELNALRLHEAAEPRRQELIRRLNQAPGGTAALVHMREDLFLHERDKPELKALDADFRYLFSSSPMVMKTAAPTMNVDARLGNLRVVLRPCETVAPTPAAATPCRTKLVTGRLDNS